MRSQINKKLRLNENSLERGVFFDADHHFIADVTKRPLECLALQNNLIMEHCEYNWLEKQPKRRFINGEGGDVHEWRLVK